MEYKVVEYDTVRDLNGHVQQMINEGWKPVGSHQVVLRHVQNRYSGLQHKDSVSTVGYSQTMIKD